MFRKPNIDLVSQSFKRAPWTVFEPLRQQGNIVKGKLPFFGDSWLVLSYDAINEVLRDPSRFARDSTNAGRGKFAGLQWWMPRSLLVLANNMLAYDGEDHRRLRSLVDQAFLRNNIDSMRCEIDTLVSSHLENCQRVANDSQDQTVDLVANLCRPLPLAVICELLGLPDADRDQFSKWAESALSVTSAWGVFKAIPSLKKMIRYSRQQIERVRQNPRPGLLSALVQAKSDGEQLSEDELLAMVFLLLVAGHETTTHLLSGGLLALLEFPQQKQKLFDDWSLINSTVHEILRYAAPVQMAKPRFARMDMQFYGQSIKRGDGIVSLLAAGNFDPEKFEQPTEFRITRAPNPHLTFGSGVHVCLGMKLAIAEAEITIEKVFRQFPNLRLGIDTDDLRWHPRLGMRALKQLPVRF